MQPFDFAQGKNAKFKVSGFSLIELILVVSILAIVVIMASNFLLSTLSSSGKAGITKEVKQNGNFALSVMEALILNSTSVNCPDDKTISLTDTEGSTTVFFCDETEGKISSNSANLTADNVKVFACQFTCENNVGKPSKVSINFSVREKSALTLRPGEKTSLDFQTEVVTKNF